jgi:hypothetical protein
MDRHQFVEFFTSKGLPAAVNSRGQIQLGLSLIDKHQVDALSKSLAGKRKGAAQATQNRGNNTKLPPELFMSWDVLDQSNKLAEIKGSNYDLYCVLYRKEFGKYPKNLLEKCPSNKWVDYEKALLDGSVKDKEGLNLSDGSDTDQSLNKLDFSKYPKELFMSWDELDMAGKIAEIAERDINLYCVLFKSCFNEYPKDYHKRIDPTLLQSYEKARATNEMEKMKEMDWDDLVADDLTQKLRVANWDIYCEKFKAKYGKEPNFFQNA